MIPKMDYALKELIVAMVSALPHAQPHQLPQQQQNNAQLSPGICVSTMQPLLDIPKRVVHHTLVKQFKLASECVPELIFQKDRNAGPTLIPQEHVQMGSNVLTMFAQCLQIMLHVLKLECAPPPAALQPGS